MKIVKCTKCKKYVHKLVSAFIAVTPWDLMR